MAVKFSESDQERIEAFYADLVAAQGIVASLQRECNMLNDQLGTPGRRTASRLVAAETKLGEASYCWDYDVRRGYGTQTKAQKDAQVQHELA